MSNNSEWKIALIDDKEGIRKITGISLMGSDYQVETADGAKPE